MAKALAAPRLGRISRNKEPKAIYFALNLKGQFFLRWHFMALDTVQKGYLNVNDFLDDLPPMPCTKPPSGGRYCNICVRINRDVAQECQFSGLTEDFVVEDKPRFKVVAGATSEKKMSFKVISGGPEGAQAPGQTPIPGIEKEFPLIEIVKPQNPTVKPLEMELLEEEPVVFEMASEEDLKKQETDEVLKNIIIAAQPLLERAKGLGMDTSQISAKMREGVGLYSKGELEKAHSLLKDIVGSIVMESVLFTQNKLESVLKKKPDEKTLPRYFAEAGVQFKKKDYPKTFDYLKYVVDQSTKIEKDIEDAQAKAAKAKEEEMSWEGDDIIGITVLEEEDAEDDDDTPVVCAVTVDEEPAGKDVKVLKPISKKPDAAPKAPAKKTVKGKKHVAHSAKLPSKNVVGKAQRPQRSQWSKPPKRCLPPNPHKKPHRLRHQNLRSKPRSPKPRPCRPQRTPRPRRPRQSRP
jgi:hypothetical protein